MGFIFVLGTIRILNVFVIDRGEQYTMLLTKNLGTPRLTIRSWNKSDKDFTLSLDKGGYEDGTGREGTGRTVSEAVCRSC